MKDIQSIESIDKLYNCSSSYELKSVTVHHEVFHGFCLLLKGLIRELGDEYSNLFWYERIKPLKRYRFILTSNPIPFSEKTIITDSEIKRIKTRIDKLDDLYPEFAELYRALIERFEILRKCNDNPIMEKIRSSDDLPELLNNGAVVLLRPRFTDSAKRAANQIKELKDLRFIPLSSLKHGPSYKALAVCGPTGLYPDFVFTAPRASTVISIQYEWIRNRKINGNVFIDPVKKKRKLTTQLNHLKESVGRQAQKSMIMYDELVQTANWDALAQQMRDDTDFSGREIDTVIAFPVLLEDDAAVFLDASADSQVFIVDPEGASVESDIDHDDVVYKIPAADLVPGMYILLRTKGSGDYIVNVANDIMGIANAKQLRSMQKDWKFRLDQIVEEKGMTGTISILQKEGSGIASQQNIRNWISERSIRPFYDEDFDAILKLAGIDAVRSNYFNMAKEIKSAHRKAGHEIRRQLIDVIKRKDLTELLELGRMEFKLPGVKSGSLTAFRILEIFRDDKVSIPYFKEGEVIEGSEIWQG